MNLLPYTPDRREDIVELMNAALGRTDAVRRDVDYWIWKHEQNPFGPSIVLLAEIDGRLAGMRAFMRWRLNFGGETVEAAKPVDSVTHPDFQRRGIFSRLTVAACEEAQRLGVRLLFNTPNQNSLPGYLKLGWQKVGELPVLARAVHPLRAAWRLARRRPLRLRDESIPAGRSGEATSADAFLSEGGGDFLLATGESADAAIRTDQNSAFLRWRYAGHPHLRYSVQTLERGGSTAGAAIFRHNERHGLHELLIDDIVVSGNSVSVLRELVRGLGCVSDADYLALHSGERASKTLAVRRAGFHRVPGKRITLVGRVLENDFAIDPLRPENWALCLGDLEGL